MCLRQAHEALPFGHPLHMPLNLRAQWSQGIFFCVLPVRITPFLVRCVCQGAVVKGRCVILRDCDGSMHAHMHTRIHTCTCTRARARAHTHTHTHTPINTHNTHAHTTYVYPRLVQHVSLSVSCFDRSKSASVCPCLWQHTSAYASIRLSLRLSVCLCLSLSLAAYVSIRQHTSKCASVCLSL